MKIEEYLLSLSAPAHHIGFDQLACTLQHMLDHPNLKLLNHEIYPAVAAAFHTTPACIDHNLRTAIEYIWQNGDPERLLLLGCGSLKYRPSNKEFLFAVTRRLRLLQSADTAAHFAASKAIQQHGQTASHPL